MNAKISQQAVAFANALDLDYSVDAFEVLVSMPDFWSTAREWIENANKPNDPNSPYTLTPKRASSIISLLTAQPNNKQCTQDYEAFVMLAHDILVHSVREMINRREHTKEIIDETLFDLPERYSEELSEVYFHNEKSLIEEFTSQVTETNRWKFYPHTLNSLNHMAKEGRYPLSIIEQEFLYVNVVTQAPVACLLNTSEPETIKHLFSALLWEGTLHQLFDAAFAQQYDDLKLTYSDCNLTPHEVIALCVKNESFKNAFEWDWKALSNHAVDKITNSVKDARHASTVEYTQIESPSAEYKDKHDDVNDRANELSL